MAGRHQPRLASGRGQFPRPAMRGRTGLKADQAGRQRGGAAARRRRSAPRAGATVCAEPPARVRRPREPGERSLPHRRQSRSPAWDPPLIKMPSILPAWKDGSGRERRASTPFRPAPAAPHPHRAAGGRGGRGAPPAPCRSENPGRAIVLRSCVLRSCVLRSRRDRPGVPRRIGGADASPSGALPGPARHRVAHRSPGRTKKRAMPGTVSYQAPLIATLLSIAADAHGSSPWAEGPRVKPRRDGTGHGFRPLGSG